MNRNLSFSLALLTAGLAWATESWIPPFQDLPDTSTLMNREEAPFEGAEGLLEAGAFCKKISLDGMWKLSPLETSERPFPAMDEHERTLAAPGFDDSSWNDIQVPLNWFLHPANQYGRLFHSGKHQDNTPGASNAVNSYVKGWYRYELEMPETPPGTRVFLHFERIGYEADVFVNGIQTPRHHHGEFIEFTTEVTRLFKPGKNLIALRVLTNFWPWDGKFTHTHGAKWGLNAGGFKGGLWGHVSLEFKANPVVESAKLIARADGHFEIHAEISHDGSSPVTVIPSLSITRAVKGAKPSSRDFEAMALEPGMNHVSLSLDMPSPDLWAPWSPSLYFAVLSFKSNGKTLSAHTERFGFRDMEIRGKDFYVNGIKTYLFFESAHSERFGGYDTPTGNRKNYGVLDDGQRRTPLPAGEVSPSFDPFTFISNYRKRGYTMLRTAHMPINPEFLDMADELGMMIYSEWGLAFTRHVNEPVFMKNNREELEEYVRETHNHPSIVMWSMGNEVFHKYDDGLVRQMNNQVDWMHELDIQGRPVCSFAGMTNVEAYGDSFLKTDFFDTHTYYGISAPWPAINQMLASQKKEVEKVFGPMKTPLLVSECVGGGWGHSYDDTYRQDPSHYLAVMSRPYKGDLPGPAGYSGAIGVEAASDRNRGMRFLQNRLGRRVLDLLRQNPDIAGFAPWFADCEMESAVVWNQPHYPGLRAMEGNGITPRQWIAEEERTIECFVHNAGHLALEAPVIHLSLSVNDKDYELGDVSLARTEPGERSFAQATITMPRTEATAGELKLTLMDNGKEMGRNSFCITLHVRPVPIAEGHVRPLAIIECPGTAMDALAEAGIHGTPVHSSKELAAFDRALIHGGASLSPEFQAAIRNWVRSGGFLAILEPDGENVMPCFPEYGLFDATAPLVERVLPEHPVFKGLSMDDFDSWAEGKDGSVVSKILTPQNITILAGKGHFSQDKLAGMAVAEAQFGKGRLLISTINALEHKKLNGAAATFLDNLLRYIADDTVEPMPAPAPLAPKQFFSHFDPGTNSFEFIDLRPFANRDFRDETASDTKGGWTDQGANDFRNIRPGVQKAAGVEFDIIDAVKNGGNGCIILNGSCFGLTVDSVEGIPVGKKAKALYFLHTCAYLSDDKPFAFYHIHYSDGRKAVIPLIPNGNVADWWGQVAPANAFSAFSSANAFTDRVSFYAFEWLNPFPDTRIESIDFVSTGRGAVPILAGITILPQKNNVQIMTAGDSPKTVWIAGAFPAGAPMATKPATVVETRVETEFGAPLNIALITMPKNGPRTFSYAICRIHLDRLEGHEPTYLNILFRSNSKGWVDVMVPQATWKGALCAPLDLSLSNGEFVRVRLNLATSFHLFDAPFNLADLRNEIGFFNGKDIENGMTRNNVSFELADIWYEY